MKYLITLLLFAPISVLAQDSKDTIRVNVSVAHSCKFINGTATCTPGSKQPEQKVVERTTVDDKGVVRPITVQEFIY